MENTEQNELENNTQEKEMGFLDHFDELRKRIVYAVLCVLLGMGVAFYYIDFIMNGILLKPAEDVHLTLQNLKVFGKVMLYFKVAGISGIIIAFPLVLYQIWKFVEPALYKSEKNWAYKITFFTTLCFASGVVFSYYVMLPPMLSFSVDFGLDDNIKTVVDINEYWSFVLMMILSAGIFFELPMVSFILSRLGLITPRFLRKYRRHAIVIILIIAAVLTPTPDPYNQMIVAVPIYILYEISILIAHLGMKQYYGASQE